MLNLRAALFLRMAELLRSHAPLLDDAGEREALVRGWYEIGLEVQHECDAIHEEQDGRMTA